MRLISLSLNVLVLTAAAFSQTTPAPEGFHLQDGTPVRLRLQRTISSAHAQVNEQIDFDTLDDVKVNGVPVIPKGSIAWGTITAAQSKRRMARGGKLDLNIDAVKLVTGEKVALRAVQNSAGGGHTGAMAGGEPLATAVFVPVAAPLFLLMHGKDVSIPKGTEITAYINGDVHLDPVKFGLGPLGPVSSAAPKAQSASAKAPAPAARASEELSTLVLKSDPDGGEISLDGKFFGNTPSTVQLPQGECSASIQKPGFMPWQRTVTITPGGIVTSARPWNESSRPVSRARSDFPSDRTEARHRGSNSSGDRKISRRMRTRQGRYGAWYTGRSTAWSSAPSPSRP